jgi:hypothetical protein
MLSLMEQNDKIMLDIDAKYASEDKLKRAFHNEAIEVYKALYEHFYKVRPELDYPAAIHSLNSVVRMGFTTKQAICMVFLHFEWKGFEGNNINCLKMLYDRHFPIRWIEHRCGMYSGYIMGTIGKKEWNDPKYLDGLLAKWELVLFGSKVS